MSDLEYRILDELYFLSSFENLIENVSDKRDAVLNALKNLLDDGLVTQVRIEGGKEEKLELPDYSSMEESYFVASKRGLLIHNSRN